MNREEPQKELQNSRKTAAILAAKGIGGGVYSPSDINMWYNRGIIDEEEMKHLMDRVEQLRAGNVNIHIDTVNINEAGEEPDNHVDLDSILLVVTICAIGMGLFMVWKAFEAFESFMSAALSAHKDSPRFFAAMVLTFLAALFLMYTAVKEILRRTRKNEEEDDTDWQV